MKSTKTTFSALSIALLYILMGCALNAQSGKMTRANKKYDNLSFIDAIRIYEDVASSGYGSDELFMRLGNSYYFNSRYAEAAKWYGALFERNGNQPAIYSLRYSQSLLSIGDEASSKRYYDAFISSVPVRGGLIGGPDDYLSIIEVNSGRYDLSPLSSNSQGIDFGGSYMGDSTLVFASTRDTLSLVKRRSTWDGLSFLDLYQGNIGGDGQLNDIEKLKGDIRTRYHESSAAFSSDGSTMYFTRNSGKGTGDIIHLKLYRASLVDGDWTDVEELSINGENFSTAHPSLSADGGRLYFVSDRPEAIGQTDIFYCDIDDEGNLGRVFNAGDHINTAGRESFPYVTGDNELYFSSDGHYGLGGYDVFYVRLDGGASSLLNVGRPVNTAFDDFAYVIRDGRGYVSSNRPSEGSSSYDNIYAFVENEPIQELLKIGINGIVTDADTGAPIGGVKIRILDGPDNVVAELSSDENGRYLKDGLDRDVNYTLQFFKDGYENGEVFSRPSGGDREHNVALVPVPVDPIVDNDGPDLAELLNIKIYFDLDSSVIRPDAEVELQKIVSAMKLYPEIRVDVRSHTDSRASDAYNMALSQRRADSTVSYLVANGINRSRLTAKGYGETQLVNGCVNGVKCSEAEHQRNRRSEFIVVE